MTHQRTNGLWFLLIVSTVLSSLDGESVIILKCIDLNGANGHRDILFAAVEGEDLRPA